MEKQKSLKMNFLMNIVLTLSRFIFPIITFPYISRILLPEGTGKVSFANSIITYFLMFAQLGIPTYGIRACAKVRENKEELTRLAHELFIINIITSIIAYVVLFICIFTVDRLKDDRVLYLISSFTIILSTIGMEWLYKALEQYVYITIRSIIFKFIALIAMFLLIHTREDYILYGAISIFASSASYVFNFINLHKYIYLKPVGNYNFKRHIRPVIIFFAMSCATIIYTNLDTIMLGFIKSDIDVGYYNAAVKVRTILLHIVTALGAVLLPRASYYVEKGLVDDFKRITNKALQFVFLVATPLTVFFMIFAKESIFFLSGDAYLGAIMPMKIIMPTLLFAGVTNITGIQVLIPMGKEKAVFYSEVLGAFTDLVLNFIFIPLYGCIGAAIGTLMAEIVVFLYQYYVIKNMKIINFKNIRYFNIIIGVVIAVVASVWVKMFRLNNFETLFYSACCFFGVYFIFLILRKENLIVEVLKIVISKYKVVN